MGEKQQLSRVAVLGLFGLFDHAVTFQTLDRVTILHGPNGVGKTVILRLIHALFSGHYEFLLDTTFQELTIGLTDGRSITIARPAAENTLDGEARRLLAVSDNSSGNEPFRWTRDRGQYRRMAEFIDHEVATITRMSEEVWTDDRTGEIYPLVQLVHKFRDVLPDKLRVGLVDDPDWLRDFRSAVSVHLVETQRLLLADHDFDGRRFRLRPPSHRRVFKSTVKNYSNDLKNKMATALTAYAEHSQALDRTFPQRMLGGPKTEALDTLKLKDRMNKLEQRRDQLKNIGLIEDDASYPFDIDTLDSATTTQKAVMTLYVEDTESKLSVLSGLEEKVDLLLGNINRKFRPNKTLRADRRLGLVVRDKKGLRIDLDSLSSGEQHELVLIYDLLFQVTVNSLVLIDEPELSLHVTWQRAFLKELFAIIKSVNFDVLLATHSPFIVGDREDLMVPLAQESVNDDSEVKPVDVTLPPI